ncbi:hypothetical protein FRC03_010110 [Tulasnella sp. 419]|nr:hypothetical protein FRC03_010110 [Tulasnella sp. 419]
MAPKRETVMAHALRTPAFNKLASKGRIVLASASPRRKEILKIFGIDPETIPSTFNEDLPHSDFPNVYEYPVATATQKGLEVYERLVLQDPESPPDLVIAVDTVVLTHITPPTSDVSPSLFDDTPRPDILEKPTSKKDNLRMLLDLNGRSCEVVTGVVVIYPVLVSPGYAIKSMEDRTLVTFAENPVSLLEAYVDSEEGLDRAGGFSAQGLGGLLIRKFDGDFYNVVGFPAAAFFKFLELLIKEEDDFLALD